MAKILNIFGNQKLEVKKHCFSQFTSWTTGRPKRITSGFITLEHNYYIAIRGGSIVLKRGNSKSIITKHSPSYRQIKRMIAISNKKYRLHGILNGKVYGLNKIPNLSKISEQLLIPKRKIA